MEREAAAYDEAAVKENMKRKEIAEKIKKMGGAAVPVPVCKE